MQPYTVNLLFHGRPFATVALELGYDELEATTNEPIERILAPEVFALFSELGLGTPAPVPVLPLHHQIGQKLHACTEPGNERAHDSSTYNSWPRSPTTGSPAPPPAACSPFAANTPGQRS